MHPLLAKAVRETPAIVSTNTNDRDLFIALDALHVLFPNYKEAGTIAELKEVKRYSDNKNWKAKHGKLRELINKYPNDFIIDSRANSIVGITHVPSGFRFHAPLRALPLSLRTSESSNVLQSKESPVE